MEVKEMLVTEGEAERIKKNRKERTEEAKRERSKNGEKEKLIMEAREIKEQFRKFMVRVDKIKRLITRAGVTVLGWTMAYASSKLDKVSKEIEEIEI
jgi:hypothetical protein